MFLSTGVPMVVCVMWLFVQGCLISSHHVSLPREFSQICCSCNFYIANLTMEKSSVSELLTCLSITTLSKMFFSSLYVGRYSDIIYYVPVTYNCEQN